MVNLLMVPLFGGGMGSTLKIGLIVYRSVMGTT